MTEIEMKRCIARYSEAFDVLLKEVDGMKRRIEALEGRNSCYGSNKRVRNAGFNNGKDGKAHLRISSKKK